MREELKSIVYIMELMNLQMETLKEKSKGQPTYENIARDAADIFGLSLKKLKEMQQLANRVDQ